MKANEMLAAVLSQRPAVPMVLGQVRVAVAGTPELLYSPDQGKSAVIAFIIICNTTGAAVKARIFLDDNGTTEDQTTALLYDKSIPANDYLALDFFMAMSNSLGALAADTETNDALTFTAFGWEIQ